VCEVQIPTLFFVFPVTLGFYFYGLYKVLIRGVELTLLQDVTSGWGNILVCVFWMSIFVGNLYAAFKTPAHNVAKKLNWQLEKWERILCIVLSPACPLVSVLLLFQDALLANKMSRNKDKFDICSRNLPELSENHCEFLMKLYRKHEQLAKSQNKLSRDRAVNAHLNLVLGSFMQMMTLCILAAAFAEAPTVGIFQLLFALAGWTWQRCRRYIQKKEDPVPFMGQILIGSRMLLEDFSCLCTLFFIANPCYGLHQPNTIDNNSFLYATVPVFFHFLTVICFNIDIPEMHIGNTKYHRLKGIGLRKALIKAVSSQFFPDVGKDWDEPQGQYGTDDSRNTSEEALRDWHKNLGEYSVIVLFQHVRNMVLMYPALKCFCQHEHYWILTLPILLFF